MDAKLQILLRQYQLTNDPTIGLQLASALARTQVVTPTAWVVMFRHEHFLFYTATSAQQFIHKAVFTYIENKLKEEGSLPGDIMYLSGIRDTLKKLTDEGNYDLAIDCFNNSIADGRVQLVLGRFQEDV